MKKLKKPKIGEFNKFGFNIIISHAITQDLNLDSVFMRVSKVIPKHLLVGLDSIYVGSFSFLEDRSLNAMYKDGALYISNDQDNEEDMIDDIIHEIAHLVEDNYGQFIYEDQTVLREFVTKRKQLYHNLESEEEQFNTYMPNYGLFLNSEYDENFDMFLYKVVGYQNLAMLTTNLFYSPYGATSLREYFANGFEAYYHHRDMSRLKSISPALFLKIVNLENIE